VLGLLLLREFQPVTIYATAAVRRALVEQNALFRLLERVEGQSTWIEMQPGRTFSPHREASLLPLSLPGAFPGYVRDGQALAPNEAVVALVAQSSSGKRLLYAPALPRIGSDLIDHMQGCDVVLIDGTFWSDDELRRVRGSGPSAREIGHLPISGPGGSLESLSGVRGPRKIYIHINNTNPVLDEDSAEHGQVRQAGWEIAQDGWEFEL
jgi:pyrroloquinoline quinone biosynthesis protein B